jgi:hypothetical protein
MSAPMNLSQMSFLSASTIPPDASFNFDQIERDAMRMQNIANRNPYEVQQIQQLQQQQHSMLQQSVMQPVQMSFIQPQQHQQSFVHGYPQPQQHLYNQQQQQMHQSYMQPYNVPLAYHQYYNQTVPYGHQSMNQSNANVSQQQFVVHSHSDQNRYNQPNSLEYSETSQSQKEKKVTKIQEFKLSERKDKSEKVKKELEEKMKAECTFKPKINNYSGSKKDRDKEERLKALAANRREEYLRREQEKEKLERNELDRFAFQPNLDRSKGNINPEVAIHATERLAKEADNRYAKREQAKREQEMAEINQHNFIPRIHSEVPDDYVPVHEKVYELQKQKEEKLKELRMQQEISNRDIMTFEPQISDRSRAIAKSVKGMSKRRRKVSGQSEEELNCTFQPNVNPKSEEILQHLRLYNEDNDFVKRQEILNARIQKRKELLQEKENQNNVYSFKPNLNRTSIIIAESNLMRASENHNDKYERLAYKDKQKKEAIHQLIEDQYYQQFRFQPELNDISKSIGQSTNVSDYQWQAERKKRKIDLIQKEKYEFKPTLLTSKNPDTQPKYNDPTVQERKKKKIAFAQKVQEFNELKECTFVPNTNKNVSSVDPQQLQQQGPIVIKGLGTHLERMDKAKKNDIDRKEAEENAFKVKVKPQDTDLNYTIPEPFHLSEQRKSFQGF